MWQSVIGWIRLLWNTGKEVRELQGDIENLQTGERDLYQFIQALAVENELLRKDNEMLRQEIHHEREKRADEFDNLKLELRLQISEELRRLPPADHS